MYPRLSVSRVRVLLALVFLFCVKASRGDPFSIVSFTNDASSGISPAKTYTHLVDYDLAERPEDLVLANINGVQFSQGGRSGPNYYISGNAGGVYDPYSRDAGIMQLVSDYAFEHDGPTLLFNLTGLTPGEQYDLRLYNGGMYPYGTIHFNVMAQNGAVQDTFNGYNALIHGLHYLQYEYTANTSSILLTINRVEPKSAGEQTYMLSGFSNELVSVAETPEPASLSALMLILVLGRRTIRR